MEKTKSSESEVLPEVQAQDKPVMKKFPKGSGIKQNFTLILASFLVVLFGIGSGWLLSTSTSTKKAGTPTAAPGGEVGINSGIGEEEVEGLDEAEGLLVEGGREGERTHHLEREGGPSKNVYITSTAIDLQASVGKKVHVWGETLSAVRAPWLMDVIRIKEIE